MRSRSAVVVVLLLLVGACGGDDPAVSPASTGESSVTVTSTPTTEAPPAIDVRASCALLDLGPVPFDISAMPPPDERATAALTGAGHLAGFRDFYDWYLVRSTEDLVEALGARRADAPTVIAGGEFAYAQLQRADGSWKPTGWGQCRIESVAEGYGTVRFVLDPDVEPDPTATTLALRATEIACASGQSPGARETLPVVTETDDRVIITLLVESPGGNQNCPTNPSYPFVVALDAPLGARTVEDAGIWPPFVRPWPPTPASLGAQGLVE